MKKTHPNAFQPVRANLPFDKRRVEFLAAFVIAVFQLNTSNLARLANVLDLQCKKQSKYRRIKRFFTDAEIDLTIFARLILAMVKPDGKYILALDRTEWKYGAVWVNILTLSIVVGNTSIPLFWKTLNRKANSELYEKKWKYGAVWVNILTLSIVVGNTSIPLFWKTLNRKANSELYEKKTILNRFIEAFGLEDVEYLCADREFDGVKFVKYLDLQKIPFRLRVKVSMPITDKYGKPMKCGKLLRTLKIGESYKLRRARTYGEVKAYVEVERGRDSKESVIVMRVGKQRTNLGGIQATLGNRNFISELEKSRIRDGENTSDQSGEDR